MQRIKIWHQTRYIFSGIVRLQPHRLLVRPREGHNLRIESWRFETTPPATLRWHQDAHDNSVATAAFNTLTKELYITSEVIIQHYDEAPLDFLVADYAVDYPFAYELEEATVLAPYLSSPTQARNSILGEWVAGFWKPGQQVQTYGLLERLCIGINQDLSYQAREEPGVQSAVTTLTRRTGSCRDFANLFMEAARTLGLAARFVSGYLNTPVLEPSTGATHAWADVYLPGAGWKGFDPTLGELVGSKHIPTAVARSPEAVPPIAGSFFGPKGAQLKVTVQVVNL